MAHRQQGYIFKREKKAKDGTVVWTSPHYSIAYRVGAKLKVETIIGPKKRAAEELTKRLNELHDGTYREIRPITVKAYAMAWLTGLADVKPSTRRSYRSMVEQHVVPAFGDREVAALTAADVNAWLARSEATLKPKSRRNVLTLLHKLLEDARAADHCKMHPFMDRRAVRRPKALRPEDTREVEILSPAEVNRLLDAVDPHYLPLYLVAVSTGLRLGELLGLQWGDVDWAAQQIRVRRTLYRGEPYLPKSKTSRRAVDVGDQVLGTLRAVERERYGEAGAPAEAPVFTTPDGALIDPDNLRNRVWAPALKKAELRHVPMHSLRHTYASLLIAQGESVKYVQGQLGHASAMLTLNTYAHLFPTEKRTSAARLEAQLGRPSANGVLTNGAKPARNEPNGHRAEGSASALNPERSATEPDGA